MDGFHQTSFPEHRIPSNKIVSNHETYVPRRGEEVRTIPLIPPQTVEQPLPLRTRPPKKRLKKHPKRATLLDRPLFSSMLALFLLASIVVIIVYFIWNGDPLFSTNASRHAQSTLTPTASFNETAVRNAKNSSYSSTNTAQNAANRAHQGDIPGATQGDTFGNNDFQPGQSQNTVPSSTLSDSHPSPSPPTSNPSFTEETMQSDNPPETPSSERIYTVQPGDTLYRIAMKTYGNKASIETIRAANSLKDNTIYVGQQLKLPSVPSLP